MSAHPARILLPLAVAAAIACAASAEDLPGLGLADRVEARLSRIRPQLKESLSHYALVFPVDQADLLAFMAQVRVFGDPARGDDPVLGTAHGLEPHGAGLLALLQDLWRPDGRRPRPTDRFWFAASRVGLPLSALQAASERQVFLPVPGRRVPGRSPDEIEGELPGSPQLARMRLVVTGLPPAEVDAYHFLQLLTAPRIDPSRVWRNRLGQPLSAGLLLDQARAFYLASRDTPGEPADHSNLHLVEVLLADSRKRGRDPEPIVSHFLSVELRRVDFDPTDATLVLGHYAESLGLLLADERTHLDAARRRQIRDWLAWLEASWFRDVARVDPRHLTHLLRGLRLVRENRARLEEPSAGAHHPAQTLDQSAPRDPRPRAGRSWGSRGGTA